MCTTLYITRITSLVYKLVHFPVIVSWIKVLWPTIIQHIDWLNEAGPLANLYSFNIPKENCELLALIQSIRCHSVIAFSATGMTMDDLRKYEKKMQEETNKKVGMDVTSGYTSDGSNPTTPQNTPTESNSPPIVAEAEKA